ncbi:MAG: hypothetical protein WAN94_11870 [Pseudolabrys sp.]
MVVKVATFYLVSIAGSLLCGQPSRSNVVLSNESARGAITSYQVVNRSLKRDRLPIGQVGPETNLREYFKVPDRLVPNQKNDTDCKPPIDVRGRCFA